VVPEPERADPGRGRLRRVPFRLAAEGYVFDSRGAAFIAGGFDGFPQHAKAIYGREGKALARGDRLQQQDLARSLRLIASRGADAFYTGELGKAIDAEMKAAKGLLTLADLAADRAEWRKPITLRYRDVDVVTASPPANAFDYLVRLGIMSQFDNRASGHNSTEYLHRFAEATKHGFWVPAVCRRPGRRAAACHTAVTSCGSCGRSATRTR